jgi:hypothetical protein
MLGFYLHNRKLTASISAIIIVIIFMVASDQYCIYHYKGIQVQPSSTTAVMVFTELINESVKQTILVQIDRKVAISKVHSMLQGM